MIHPGTRQPIGPQDLAPLFPMELIKQEVSQERYIDIPGPVQEALRLWRPTPLHRARHLERALDLVNTALRLDADNQQDLSEDKDTKGWILFKSGKANEALPLIQEAASQIQNDPLVQSHLQVVQRAASPKGK